MRISDWSSDVCSSDLRLHPLSLGRRHLHPSLDITGFDLAEDTLVSLILDVVGISPIPTESVHQVSLGRLGCIKKRLVMTAIIPVFHQIPFEGVDGSLRFKINQQTFKILR